MMSDFKIERQFEPGACAGEIFIELKHRFAQQGIFRLPRPRRAVGQMALALEPNAGQAAGGGRDDHGAQGALIARLDDGSVEFHGDSWGSVIACQARTTA